MRKSYKLCARLNLILFKLEHLKRDPEGPLLIVHTTFWGAPDTGDLKKFISTCEFTILACVPIAQNWKQCGFRRFPVMGNGFL